MGEPLAVLLDAYALAKYGDLVILEIMQEKRANTLFTFMPIFYNRYPPPGKERAALRVSLELAWLRLSLSMAETYCERDC